MPRVLVLSADDVVASLLFRLVEQRGGEPWRGEDGAIVAGGPWALVCVDSRLPDLSPDDLQARYAAPVLWLCAEPRGRDAARALAGGANDVAGLPLWEPEVGARLDRWLPSPVGTGGVRGGGAEAPAENTDLQLLLEAQKELIPLQAPRQFTEKVRAGLSCLFPGAEVEISVLDSASEGSIPPRRVSRDQGGGWREATVPLTSGAACLGTLRVAGSNGVCYPERKLHLLDMFAAQAAQGLHRARLYEALSVGKADWEQTFDTIPDAIGILGPELRFLRVNLALAELAGCRPGEMIGQPCHLALHGRSEPCADCPVPGVFASGEAAHWPTETRREGRVFDYRAYPLLDAEGAVRAVITYGRDVTRQEQLEQGLRQTEKLMTLGQIAAGIAHEINNPLTVISSYAQLLDIRAEDPRGGESARRIRQGIERIHRLVQNLMSFAHPEDDSFYPLDLNEIVAKTLTFSRYEVTRGDTRLEQVLQPGLPKVLGSEPQLEQLFVNLLTNARDAVGGRGTVRVSTRLREGQVQLVVADDGVGIDSRELDKIFEPFYTTKPVGKGTGLGLFIAAGIAEKHRGRLSLHSVPGRGTEARFSVPAFSS